MIIFRVLAVKAMPAAMLGLAFFWAGPAVGACPPTLDFSFRPLAGETPVRLCEQYAGKVLLVVNTASQCGYTPQYAGLEALYERYRERGLVVLGFPSNDFGGQEPGTEAEIKQFCRLSYGVRFPMFEKIRVERSDPHPFYRLLAGSTGEYPAWNFHKYLLDRDGRVLASYGSRVRPDDPRLVSAIEQVLAR